MILNDDDGDDENDDKQVLWSHQESGVDSDLAPVRLQQSAANVFHHIKIVSVENIFLSYHSGININITNINITNKF